MTLTNVYLGALRTILLKLEVIRDIRPYLSVSSYRYRVILKSVKHLKNSQQIDYVTDLGNSYADRERKTL
jgi:hypothetical protein